MFFTFQNTQKFFVSSRYICQSCQGILNYLFSKVVVFGFSDCLNSFFRVIIIMSMKIHDNFAVGGWLIFLVVGLFFLSVQCGGIHQLISIHCRSYLKR